MNMKSTSTIRGAACALLLVPLGALAQSQPPVVTGVTAAQAPYPSKNVTISYTISDPVSTADNVWVLVSADGGNTWTVPAIYFGGSVGIGVPVTSTPTVKTATWYAGTDWNGNYTTTCRVRVIACNNNMVIVPAGSYQRGDNLDGESDAPVYSVFVNAFLMDNNYVSGYLWSNVWAYATSHGYSFDYSGSWQGLNYPAQANWYDAVKWCNARSQLEGVPTVYYTDAACTMLYTNGDADTVYMKSSPNGVVTNGYRLPTEAEWEKAARGLQTGQRFPWGYTIQDGPVSTGGQANYRGNKETSDFDLGPDGENSAFGGGFPNTSPGGYFPPNGYGLYDMAGNVDCWCWDWYSSSYYAAGQTNPQGPPPGSYNGTTGTRVVRGGSWNEQAYEARCACRIPYVQTFAEETTDGFRCVRGF